jgi:cysteine synthase
MNTGWVARRIDEAVNKRLLSTGETGELVPDHKIQGIGAGIIPALDLSLVDRVETVTND